MKFDVGPARLESRNHAWKFQVSPESTETKPLGCGTAERSIGMQKRVPSVPDDPLANSIRTLIVASAPAPPKVLGTQA
ncbi:MAG: hypothetical protein ACJAQ3_004419, partial [Planctomycetota bacterium]